MVDDVINRFCQEAPAAMLFRGLLARTFADAKIDSIFRHHKHNQVERELLFSSLLDLLTPVVSGAKPSLFASWQQRRVPITVSFQAVYDKLRGVEPTVCAALVQEPAEELNRLLTGLGAHQPDPIAGYHTFVIDGKRLDGTEHRLKETRTMKSAPLPGSVMAMLDTRAQLFVRIACDTDAYVCERKLVLPLLDHLQKGALYLADRNFCDGILIERFLKAESYFVVRQHGRSPSWRHLADKPPRKKVGKDENGATVYEQEIEVRLEDGRWQQVRRISVHLQQPTRDGDTWLHVLTNLPAETTAVAVANAYRQRWTIETCLSYVATALKGEINTLAYPKAALLCFALALVLFNMVSTLKSLLERFAQEKGHTELSYFYLALEIASAQRGIAIAIDESYWNELAKMPQEEFLSWLRSVASQAQRRHYQKHPRGLKKPPPKRTSGKGKAHVSSQRLLNERKQRP